RLNRTALVYDVSVVIALAGVCALYVYSLKLVLIIGCSDNKSMLIQLTVSCSVNAGCIEVIFRCIVVCCKVESVGLTVIIGHRNRTVFSLSIIPAAKIVHLAGLRILFFGLCLAVPHHNER